MTVLLMLWLRFEFGSKCYHNLIIILLMSLLVSFIGITSQVDMSSTLDW